MSIVLWIGLVVCITSMVICLAPIFTILQPLSRVYTDHNITLLRQKIMQFNDRDWQKPRLIALTVALFIPYLVVLVLMAFMFPPEVFVYRNQAFPYEFAFFPLDFSWYLVPDCSRHYLHVKLFGTMIQPPICGEEALIGLIFFVLLWECLASIVAWIGGVLVSIGVLRGIRGVLQRASIQRG